MIKYYPSRTVPLSYLYVHSFSTTLGSTFRYSHKSVHITWGPLYFYNMRLADIHWTNIWNLEVTISIPGRLPP